HTISNHIHKMPMVKNVTNTTLLHGVGDTQE
ncbi:hypothetical protein F442_17187, partial [Phytophthora nicotianae P10297]